MNVVSGIIVKAGLLALIDLFIAARVYSITVNYLSLSFSCYNIMWKSSSDFKLTV